MCTRVHACMCVWHAPAYMCVHALGCRGTRAYVRLGPVEALAGTLSPPHECGSSQRRPGVSIANSGLGLLPTCSRCKVTRDFRPFLSHLRNSPLMPRYLVSHCLSLPTAPWGGLWKGVPPVRCPHTTRRPPASTQPPGLFKGLRCGGSNMSPDILGKRANTYRGIRERPQVVSVHGGGGKDGQARPRAPL